MLELEIRGPGWGWISPHSRIMSTPVGCLISGRAITVRPCFDHSTIGNFTRLAHDWRLTKQTEGSTIWVLVLTGSSVMVHKCLIGRAPDYLSQKFTRRLDLHNRNTRNKKDLNLPRCRLTTGQRSFAYRGAACWNSLPKDLKEVADVGIFKRRLVNMLLAWILFCFCIILIS